MTDGGSQFTHQKMSSSFFIYNLLPIVNRQDLEYDMSIIDALSCLDAVLASSIKRLSLYPCVQEMPGNPDPLLV